MYSPNTSLVFLSFCDMGVPVNPINDALGRQFLIILALKYSFEIDIVGLTQGHIKSGVLLDMPKVMAQFGLNFYNLFPF